MRKTIDFEAQKALLEKCTREKTDVKKALGELGLSYEDLRYASNPPFRGDENSLLRLDEIRRESNGIPAISFFAGAGGFDVGFFHAGFQNLASIEIVPLFCETLRFNFPKKLVVGPPDFSGDVRDREKIATVLIEKLGIEAPFEGVFHGGPPCQPFSIAANQRFSKGGENFKRVGFEHSELGNLLFDYIWFIERFRPKAFILENVAGFSEMDKGLQVQKAIEKLRLLGYSTSAPKVFDLADFGIPQHRNRFILVGNRVGKAFHFPKKSTKQVGSWEALKDVHDGLANHERRDHKADSLLRYMDLEYGKRDQLGRVDRLNPSRPSKTVIAGGTKGGGRSHLHPFVPRTMSVRESARLQTFPDWYVFKGPSARQFTQVGNAVPPLFEFKLAYEIERQFFETEPFELEKEFFSSCHF